MHPSEDFLKTYIQNEQKIRLYIKRLVYQADDAEDIMQATALILWKKFESYKPEYPFIPWAFKIAYNEVRNYYRKNAKKNLFFDESTLEQLAQVADKKSTHLNDMRLHLKDCLLKLKDSERRLVEYRYCDDGRINDLAQEQNTTANALSKTLQKIRRQLFLCINLNLNHE